VDSGVATPVASRGMRPFRPRGQRGVTNPASSC